jgi:glycosyltransferase involved in cell wall biosynthesis
MKLAISFTNFGPYHLARLRALGLAAGQRGGRMIAYETAARERRYPWEAGVRSEPFAWVTLFPDRTLEDLPDHECARAMRVALERDQPDAVGIVGYVRPECLAALDWARANERPAILLSESQAVDRPRAWWREVIKGRRVRRFDAALVGGPTHRDYLVGLGIPADRIALGYNAVDNNSYAQLAERARSSDEGRADFPKRPYFLTVARFAPEKNLERLIWAFARYRMDSAADSAWDLALCGGGELAPRIVAAIRASGCSLSVHCPGFLQADALARWYAHASAFVLPSVSEPWGLVGNEAAACGLPLLISETAGCARSLVPDPPGTTGRRFDPRDYEVLVADLAWMAGLTDEERRAMGQRARAIVAEWGPERFAQGFFEALEMAGRPRVNRRTTRAMRSRA